MPPILSTCVLHTSPGFPGSGQCFSTNAYNSFCEPEGQFFLVIRMHHFKCGLRLLSLKARRESGVRSWEKHLFTLAASDSGEPSFCSVGKGRQLSSSKGKRAVSAGSDALGSQTYPHGCLNFSSQFSTSSPSEPWLLYNNFQKLWIQFLYSSLFRHQVLKVRVHTVLSLILGDEDS